ncbi:MAG: hypothetical protein ACOH1I_11505 [Gallionellaceae bacterium]
MSIRYFTFPFLILCLPFYRWSLTSSIIFVISLFPAPAFATIDSVNPTYIYALFDSSINNTNCSTCFPFQTLSYYQSKCNLTYIVQGNYGWDGFSAWVCGFNSSPGQATTFTFSWEVTPHSGTACPSEYPPYSFNPATGMCERTVQAVCPEVEALTPLPKDDACALSLDKGRGKDVDGKCPPLSPALPGQIQCFANKIAATNATAMPKIAYSEPTALFRNAAYQAHLREIWDKMKKLNKDENRNNTACQARRNEIIAEKGCSASEGCDKKQCTVGSHCIVYQPATSSNHTKGTAFDVPKDTIKGLLQALTPLPPAPMTPLKQLQAQRFWIATWLANPTTCNLYWGGNFQEPDRVHFQLP